MATAGNELSEREKERIRKLAEQGVAKSVIATALHLSRSTVCKYAEKPGEKNPQK